MMFKVGFEKSAAGILKLPKPRVDPVTTRDALGASRRIKPPSIASFASGHHPRMGLKSMSKVRRV
jgi:hypothetical protein